MVKNENNHRLKTVFRKVGVAHNFFGVAKTLEFLLNTPDSSVLVGEGVEKLHFKCQGCREAQKFAEHCLETILQKL